jgi:hypothetical protein
MSTTSWNGNLQCINQTGGMISNVSVEHINTGSARVTLTSPSLADSGRSVSKVFTTAKGKTDHWFASFLDASGNLLTGSGTIDFHSSYAEQTVDIVFFPGNFEVRMPSGSNTSEKYDQII